MDKRKRSLSLKDRRVLVSQAVVVKVVKRVMTLIVNTVIKRMIKLNQSLRTKKVNQIV